MVEPGDAVPCGRRRRPQQMVFAPARQTLVAVLVALLLLLEYVPTSRTALWGTSLLPCRVDAEESMGAALSSVALLLVPNSTPHRAPSHRHRGPTAVEGDDQKGSESTGDLDVTLDFSSWDVDPPKNAVMGNFPSGITMGRYVFFFGGADILKGGGIDFETYIFKYAHTTVKAYDYHRGQVVTPYQLLLHPHSADSDSSSHGDSSASSSAAASPDANPHSPAVGTRGAAGDGSRGDESKSSSDGTQRPPRSPAQLYYPAVGSNNVVRIGLTVYVIGFCTMVPEVVQPPQDDEDSNGKTSQFLRSVQRIRLYQEEYPPADDITVDIENWTIPDEDGTIALRFNASCIASGDSIFIVGGVSVTDRTPLDTIAQYNVRLNHLVDAVRSTGVPLVTPGIVSTSGLVFIVGGLTPVRGVYPIKLVATYSVHVLKVTPVTLEVYRDVERYAASTSGLRWSNPKAFVFRRQLAVFGECANEYASMCTWNMMARRDGVYMKNGIMSPPRSAPSLASVADLSNTSVYMFGGTVTSSLSPDVFSGTIFFADRERNGEVEVAIFGCDFVASPTHVAAAAATPHGAPLGHAPGSSPAAPGHGAAALEGDRSSGSSSDPNGTVVSPSGTPTATTAALSVSETPATPYDDSSSSNSSSSSSSSDDSHIDIPNNRGNVTVYVNGYVPLWYNISVSFLFEPSLLEACPGMVMESHSNSTNTTSTCEVMLSLSDQCDAVITTPGYLRPSNTKRVAMNRRRGSSPHGTDSDDDDDDDDDDHNNDPKQADEEEYYYSVGPYTIVGNLEEGIMYAYTGSRDTLDFTGPTDPVLAATKTAPRDVDDGDGTTTFYSQVFVYVCFSTSRSAIPACSEFLMASNASVTDTGNETAHLEAAADVNTLEGPCTSSFYRVLNAGQPYVMSPVTDYIPPVPEVTTVTSTLSEESEDHIATDWEKYTAVFVSIGIVGCILLLVAAYVASQHLIQTVSSSDSHKSKEEYRGLLAGLKNRLRKQNSSSTEEWDDEDDGEEYDGTSVSGDDDYLGRAGSDVAINCDAEARTEGDAAAVRGGRRRHRPTALALGGGANAPSANSGAGSGKKKGRMGSSGERARDDGGAAAVKKMQHNLLDGKYRILRRLGKGSFSVVYLVERMSDKRQFALKYVQCADDVDRVEAMRECEVAYTLQGHPNVIQLVDMFMSYKFDTNLRGRGAMGGELEGDAVGETVVRIDSGYYAIANGDSAVEGFGGAPPPSQQPQQRRMYHGERYLSLVMAYHDKGDLGKWVRRMKGQPPIPEATVVSIAFQVLSVLQFMHRRSPPIIHRDLKPENILLSSAVRYENVSPHFLPIVVTDFGLSRVMDKTFCETGVGSLPYVAPECWQRHYTIKVDIWALGCILYAVCTKRVEADNVRVMFSECNRKDFQQNIQVELTQVCHYSTELASFISYLLEVSPEKRPSSVEALQIIRQRLPAFSDEQATQESAWMESLACGNGNLPVAPAVADRSCASSPTLPPAAVAVNGGMAPSDSVAAEALEGLRENVPRHDVGVVSLPPAVDPQRDPGAGLRGSRRELGGEAKEVLSSVGGYSHVIRSRTRDKRLIRSQGNLGLVATVGRETYDSCRSSRSRRDQSSAASTPTTRGAPRPSDGLGGSPSSDSHRVGHSPPRGATASQPRIPHPGDGSGDPTSVAALVGDPRVATRFPGQPAHLFAQHSHLFQQSSPSLSLSFATSGSGESLLRRGASASSRVDRYFKEVVRDTRSGAALTDPVDILPDSLGGAGRDLAAEPPLPGRRPPRSPQVLSVHKSTSRQSEMPPSPIPSPSSAMAVVGRRGVISSSSDSGGMLPSATVGPAAPSTTRDDFWPTGVEDDDGH